MDADLFWLLPVIAFPVAAIILDWSIFVPIDNYLHIANPKRVSLSFRARTIGNPLGRFRTIGIFLSGLSLSVGILFHNIVIFVISFMVFLFFHILIYFVPESQ